MHYQAESPDEAALVAAAREFGFFFFRRTNTTVLVREGGADAEFEILNILEFDSTRKRMSIICRTPEGQIMLYCKARFTPLLTASVLPHVCAIASGNKAAVAIPSPPASGLLGPVHES